jgi:hypothetical protein
MEFLFDTLVLKPSKVSPIRIGILGIIKSSQESNFDILLSNFVFMKKYYKRLETKEKIFFKIVLNNVSKTTSVLKLSLKTKDS